MKIQTVQCVYPKFLKVQYRLTKFPKLLIVRMISMTMNRFLWKVKLNKLKLRFQIYQNLQVIKFGRLKYELSFVNFGCVEILVITESKSKDVVLPTENMNCSRKKTWTNNTSLQFAKILLSIHQSVITVIGVFFSIQLLT